MTAHPDGTGQTAVVTGAGGGLGAAIADRLAARGCTVVRADIAGTDTALDVTDADACRKLATDVQPDIWVNNAGVLGAGDAATQPDAEIERVIRVNLFGVINGTRAAIEVMRVRGAGHILNVGSLASWTPVPGEAVYAATKAGVLSYTVGVASELRDSGIHFAVLCPDGIWSPMLYERLEDPAAAMSFTGSRLLTPEEVATAAMRLLDSGRIVASVPPARGLQTRLIGIAPGVALKGAGLFEKIGLRNQRKFREQLAERGEHAPNL
jgi:short-subunit dehydrogenase